MASLNDDALVRIREVQERQLETLHDAITKHVENEQVWARELATPMWAPALAKMTSRQNWLAEVYWDLAREAWSRFSANVAIGRVIEAMRGLDDYQQNFDVWAHLHLDIFRAAQAGQSTARIGESLLPAGYAERRVERDDQGRIKSIVEREAKVGRVR